MKKVKIVAIVMVMTLACTLTACSNDKDKSKIETSVVENANPDDYTIEDDVYNVKNVVIKYPTLKYSDDEKTNIISSFLENGGVIATKYYDKEDQDNLNMNIKYKVRRKNKNIISVVYEGTAYLEGAAYANNYLYSVNVDLKNKKILKFINKRRNNHESYWVLTFFLYLAASFGASCGNTKVCKGTPEV